MKEKLNLSRAALQKRLANFDSNKEDYWRYSNLSFLKTFSPKLANRASIDSKDKRLSPQDLIKESFFNSQEQQLLSFSCLKSEEHKSYVDCIPRLVFVNGYYEPTLSYMGAADELVVDQPGDDFLFSNASGNPSGRRGSFFSRAERDRVLKKGAEEGNVLFDLSQTLSAEAGRTDRSDREIFVRVQSAPFVDRRLPLFLFFFMREQGEHAVAVPRLHFLVEKRTELALTEFHCSQDNAAFENAFLNFEIADEAKLIHLCFQEASDMARHAHTAKVCLGGGSGYDSFFYSRGAGTSIGQRLVEFEKTGGSANLKGLYLTDGSRHLDNLISIKHKVAGCESDQFYQGILRDKARVGFTGRVIVEKDAQQTNSSQLSKSIILGEAARMYSRPELDIQADDVKCAHGATVGRLREEDIFYLNSRGLAPKKTEALLSFAGVNQFFSALSLAFPRLSPLLSERCFEQNFL